MSNNPLYAVSKPQENPKVKTTSNTTLANIAVILSANFNEVSGVLCNVLYVPSILEFIVHTLILFEYVSGALIFTGGIRYLESVKSHLKLYPGIFGSLPYLINPRLSLSINPLIGLVCSISSQLHKELLIESDCFLTFVDFNPDKRSLSLILS